MNMIEADIPFFFKGETSFKLKLDPELSGRKDCFLRFELYPKLSPAPKLRQYGLWDIDLARLPKKEVELFFDWEYRILNYKSRRGKTEAARSIIYNLSEHGYAIMHISVLRYNRDKSRTKLASSWHTLYLERVIGDSSPQLKQVNIPVTDQCNLECIMCPRHKVEGFHAEYCDAAIIDKLMEEFPRLTVVLLQGLGEPTLYPGLTEIIKRFKAVAKPGATIGTTTNATLLDRDRAIELCQAGLDFIYFSVDGVTKEVYEKIRVGADFDKVIVNITGMIEVAKKYCPELRTMFNFVIQPDNVHQIPDIAELAVSLGINGITYSYSQQPDMDDLNPFGAEAMKKAFTEAEARVGGSNIFLGFPPVRPVEGAHCSFLEGVCMLCDGRVLSCHAMAPGYANPECMRNFGSLPEHSLSEIWNSPEFVKFRDDVLHERYPATCQGCFCLKYLVP